MLYETIGREGQKDSLIGIASSGRTPYVLGGLEFAKSRGCATVGIACTSPSALGQRGHADSLIEAVTGPEVVTGSTRIKAGTATKLILNTISSGIMIRVGKTFGNIMVDVKPTNIKLEHRARYILRMIVGTGPGRSYTDAQLDKVLAACDRSVKTAAVAVRFDISPQEAKSRLQAANGVLATLIRESPENSIKSVDHGEQRSRVVFRVDAGGSRCRATILHPSGIHGTGESGSCNVTERGSKAAVAEIKLAIERAIRSCPATENETLETLASLNVLSTWVSIAGGDRKNSVHHLRSQMEWDYPSLQNLRITNDVELLATVAGEQTGATDVVVLIAGTGSIAMHYRRQSSGFEQIARAGGWGPLLGDDGSGFDAGRQAIRAVLQQLDVDDTQTQGSVDGNADDLLRKAILDHYRPESSKEDEYDLLSAIMLGEPDGAGHAPAEAKRRIASCAHVVIALAETSPRAASIVKASQNELSTLVRTVTSRSKLQPSRATLVLAGGVTQSIAFRSELTDALALAGSSQRSK